MKTFLLTISLTLVVLASCSADKSETPQLKNGWQIYTNSKYGYEIQYPDGFELWATGLESERDGARIRIAFKEYAAPAPVLDIQVEPRVPLEQFPTLGAEVPKLTVRVEDILVNGRPAKQAQYHWAEGGDLAFAEIYLEGVIFRFDAAAGTRDFQEETQWWAIISTFRFKSR